MAAIPTGDGVNSSMAAIPTAERAQPQQSAVGGGGCGRVIREKVLSAVNKVVKLLPSVTLFAFQSLHPYFSKRGQCYASNKYLTWGLIIACSISCFLFSFTDSIVGEDGGLYYGVATKKGFVVFNFDGSSEERERNLPGLENRRIKLVDWIHAFVSTAAFFMLALVQSDVRRCVFPEMGNNKKQWFEKLPLGVAVFSSVVLLIFPTSRKGIGYSDLHRRNPTPTS